MTVTQLIEILSKIGDDGKDVVIFVRELGKTQRIHDVKGTVNGVHISTE